MAETMKKLWQHKWIRLIGKLGIVAITLCLVAFLFVMMIQGYVKSMATTAGVASYETMDTLLAEEEPYDAVIILGARVYSDTTVSAVLRDRLLTGYEVYNRGYASKIIVSGDHGQEGYDEVVAMKTFLMELGVPREDIFMDHAGFNTYDSMYRARDIFQVERAVVVTQEFHIFRSVYLGSQLGMEVVGITSDLDNYAGRVYNEVRETLARTKAVWDVEIAQRPPHHLGTAIPVQSTSGLETEDEKAAAMFDEMEGFL